MRIQIQSPVDQKKIITWLSTKVLLIDLNGFDVDVEGVV